MNLNQEILSYHGFLKINRNTIIASSLTQLTDFPLTSSKWQILDITWNNHFLEKARELLDSNTFVELRKKESEKENTFTTVTSLSKKTIKFSEKKLSKENTFTTVASQPNISLLSKKTGKSSVKNLSETLQLDLSKKNITFINDFCYDDVKNKVIEYPMDLFTINSKLENNQYTSLKEFEKDIRLIFCNCYTYNDIKSKEYCSGKILESVFNEKWNEKIILYDRQTRELKRVRDTDTDDTDNTDNTDRSWKKQCQILEQNKNNLIYRQVINDALLVASAYESLVIGNIIPFIEILKTFLLTRSRMSLSLANESMLQAIIESLLPLKYRIPELSLVMDEKVKGIRSLWLFRYFCFERNR
ncbi:hypothetical protein GLOIN_2v1790207 [Rhizophagus irregularis DAOM 181602=DAOM 197198]|uniref:Bromo domain-containing protein n=1 Tax=Rhizophagus irregularis (strain DAOM 181602 / DAOM 197198 / MUCL 43194) TaxID=747089 RepID=A0A2P4NZN9_RHIID|nr:hypothetical protein GLOIN_2v1790207 [Rhizophagus irregularis DAOM 181602=DAOM 197198]POG58578.1 hypothetical protein GLOIN_2v1790207 [Rhizophagus irregularis DAOM 181602=DAOM 197198]|eukprot:XP_025165444.1 hypothetical protein GLOIN_2v1790207 [Rhizophagus irregularis DAOM 181602=DAOM 197198]